jgi:hypothetical protein
MAIKVQLGTLFSFLFSFTWALVLVGTLIGKFMYESLTSYVMHYTNWNWTINAIFFTVDTISYISSDLLYFNLVFFYWITNASSWIVFWVVFILFQDNPDILTDLSKDEGGDYSMGFLLNMNTLFHVLPAMFIMVYTLLRWSALKAVVNNVFHKESSQCERVSYFIIFILYPLWGIFIYYVSVDIRDVYGVTTNIWIIAAVVFGVAVIYNGVTLFLLMSSRYTVKLCGSSFISIKRIKEDSKQQHKDNKFV